MNAQYAYQFHPASHTHPDHSDPYANGVSYYPPATYPLCDPYAVAEPDHAYQYTYTAAAATPCDPSYEAFPYHQTQYALPPYDAAPHIHAPVPISAYSTLLPHVTRYTPSTPAPPAATFHSVAYPSSYTVPPVIVKSSPPPEPLIPAGPAPQLDAKLLNPLELYASPQTTFPTPSELLTELAQRDLAAGITPHPELRMSVGPTRRAASPSAEPKRPPRRSKKQRAKTPAALRPPEPGKPDNLRKSYFRSLAENVGFQSTDPDTITSHDKKRYYLESLEHYVLWLHDRIALAGHTPANLERVDSYSGLSIPSMRIMLVQMQDEARELHGKLVDKEKQYFTSFPGTSDRGSADATEQNTPPPPTHGGERSRRHSIASGMIHMSPASHIPPGTEPPTTA